MTKYFACEGEPKGKYNASTKARADAEIILKSEGFAPIFIPTRYGVSKSRLGKLNQARIYASNARIWQKATRSLTSGDILLIQHPLVNTTLFMDKVLEDLTSRGVNVVVLIHDLDSLRYPSRKGTKFYTRVYREDAAMLTGATHIISHNKFMTEKLVKTFNIDPTKITDLKLFDYLLPESAPLHSSEKGIAIAGNLSTEKAAYLKQLYHINSPNFLLFGKSDTPFSDQKNVTLLGAFDPDNPPATLANCQFGLIWDGPSTTSCTGDFGNYLQINNPHKASLYLSLGLPLIAPTNSAIADFITTHNIGLAINSLEDLPKIIKNLPTKDYKTFEKNAAALAKDIRTGTYLKTALSAIRHQ